MFSKGFENSYKSNKKIKGFIKKIVGNLDLTFDQGHLHKVNQDYHRLFPLKLLSETFLP